VAVYADGDPRDMVAWMVQHGGVEVARALRYTEALNKGGRLKGGEGKGEGGGDLPVHEGIFSLDALAEKWRTLSVGDKKHH
jgi:hypothetical protein